MTFDASKPEGNAPIAQGDNDIRANNVGLQAALAVEHDFVDADAGQQTGRHFFLSGDTGSISGMNPGPKVGSIAINTQLRVNGALVWWDGAEWLPLDPGSADMPWLTDSNLWDKAQWALWGDATGVGTATVSINPELTPYQRATLNQDTLINLVTPGVGFIGGGTVIQFDLDMGVGGPYTVTFSGNVRAQGGVVQLGGADNARNMLVFTYTQDATWLVTSIPNWNVGSVVPTVALI